MEFMIFVIIFFILLYIVILYFLLCGLGVNVVKRGRDLFKIVFMFDDGLNFIYMLIFFDLLKKNEVKVIFFVVGIKVKKYFELI